MEQQLIKQEQRQKDVIVAIFFVFTGIFGIVWGIKDAEPFGYILGTICMVLSFFLLLHPVIFTEKTKRLLLHLLFTKETESIKEGIETLDASSSKGLRLIPAIIISILITAIGFLLVASFLHFINYPNCEQWFW